ncbi:MAG: glycosyltransferase [Sphingobacteriales bacterium]|nr:MAG: glycosyltransferase [Sphingobacteriales bacterium]
MRIAVYSGQIPGTTFIERLIAGIASRGNTVLLFGNKERDISYPSSVKVYVVPEGRWNMILYAVRYIIMLAITRPSDLLRLLTIVKSYRRGKFRYLLKVLPVMLHRPEIFHIQWAKSLKDWIWVKEFGIKLVVSLRGSHINYSPVVDDMLADIYKQHFPAVNAFHAVSTEIGNKASGYGAHNVHTIYSGLPLDSLPFQNGRQKSNNRFEIISVGRWHWVKGFSYAIDAISIVVANGLDVHYTIVGGQATEEALFHIKSLGLENYISIVGEVPHKDVLVRIQSADLLLVPSIVEGIANVALEAMAVGTVVLSTQCGGIAEVIKDGHSGFLVPVRNSNIMAEKIKSISSMPDTSIDVIRLNARKKIEHQHDADKMLDGFISLYQSVL